MITFLSSAKPFLGVTKTNQVRAIKSWLAVDSEAEVILYGKSEGAEAVSGELGISYIPDIECSPSGLPYFHAIAAHAAEYGRHDMQIYLNCDILFPNSILKVIRRGPFPKYLIVGKRIDLDDGVTIDASSQTWLQDLSHLASIGKARLNELDAIDYFIFPRGLWQNIKPLIIGRAGYDNALIAYCLRNRIPIINATAVILALHQYHEYSHAQGGEQEVFSGQYAIQNRKLHGIRHNAPTTMDADYVLEKDGLVHNYQRDRLRQLETCLRFRINLGPTWIVIRALWRLLNAAGLHRPDGNDIEKVLAGYSMILPETKMIPLHIKKVP